MEYRKVSRGTEPLQKAYDEVIKNGNGGRDRI